MLLELRRLLAIGRGGVLAASFMRESYNSGRRRLLGHTLALSEGILANRWFQIGSTLLGSISTLRTTRFRFNILIRLGSGHIFMST